MSVTSKKYFSYDLTQLRLLLPVLIPVLLLSVIPLLRGIYLGFTDYRLGLPISFNWFDNYSYMLNDRYLGKSLGFGFLWTICVTGGQILLGLGLAILLNQRLTLTKFSRLIILIPWAMPPVIRGIVWRLIYDADAGVFNHMLIGVGLIDYPVNWLNSFEWVMPSIIVAGIWGELPKAAVFILAGLQTIPKHLYESARLDGANAWNEFCYITFPMLKPVLSAIISLMFIWNFNTFGLVWVLTQGGPGGTTRLPMLAAYEEAFRYGNVGYAAAIGNVMVIAVSLILFFYLRKQFKGNVV